jgi:cold shock CspA family protein
MFSTSGLYGFCSSENGSDLYFHARDFHRLTPGEPPPILGEPVREEFGKIFRKEVPSITLGQVHSFDSKKGWGFISYGSEKIFFHVKDTLEGWMPVIGGGVRFYVGYHDQRPRACWVEPLR